MAYLYEILKSREMDSKERDEGKAVSIMCDIQLSVLGRSIGKRY